MTEGIDDEPRMVEPPAELAEALAADAAAKAAWEALAPSHRKEYARWVAEAKRPETRRARGAKAAAMLRAGDKLE
jgi:uncharacterized protein YdeI (YjbR/CyaY-like superfamily)